MANLDFTTDFASFLCKQILKVTTAFNLLLLDNPAFFSYP